AISLMKSRRFIDHLVGCPCGDQDSSCDMTCGAECCDATGSREPTVKNGQSTNNPSKQFGLLVKLKLQSAQQPGAATCHVWTAPRWQGLFAASQSGRSSHVYGLRVRVT